MQKGALLNVPNILTLGRIAIVPLMALAIQNNRGTLAVIILIIAGISDILDGYIARQRKQESTFGKLLDPVADKVLLCVALIFLCANPHFHLSPWLASLLLGREFFITGLRAAASALGLVIPAGTSGKAKTFFQMLGLGLYMVDSPWNMPSIEMGQVSLWIAVVLSYYSMCEYILKASRALK